MGRTACTEPQCLYKGDLYLYIFILTGLTTRKKFTTFTVRLASAYQIHTHTFEMMRVETENGNKAFIQKRRHEYLYDTTACARSQ